MRKQQRPRVLLQRPNFLHEDLRISVLRTRSHCQTPILQQPARSFEGSTIRSNGRPPTKGIQSIVSSSSERLGSLSEILEHDGVPGNEVAIITSSSDGISVRDVEPGSEGYLAANTILVDSGRFQYIPAHYRRSTHPYEEAVRFRHTVEPCGPSMLAFSRDHHQPHEKVLGAPSRHC